jgi:hypothetical protein
MDLQMRRRLMLEFRELTMLVSRNVGEKATANPELGVSIANERESRCIISCLILWNVH